MQSGLEALTEKERLTLRLMAEGHDTKSLARHLGLSVHTINERLRDARRKLGVSSSREAARLLREQEKSVPERLGDGLSGDAPGVADHAQAASPPRSHSGPQLALVAGGTIMLLILSALTLALAPQSDPPPSAAAMAPAVQSEATGAALRWLTLVDGQRWQESWSATGATFRHANTVARWQAASETARVPLGDVLERLPSGEEFVPAPPNGYMTVRFRTTFARGGQVNETLSLVREGAEWRVVGYMLG